MLVVCEVEKGPWKVMAGLVRSTWGRAGESGGSQPVPRGAASSTGAVGQGREWLELTGAGNLLLPFSVLWLIDRLRRTNFVPTGAPYREGLTGLSATLS